MTAIAARRYTAGSIAFRSPNTRPADRTTTRTARSAMPTLHSTPKRLGPGARVGDHQRGDHGHDDHDHGDVAARDHGDVVVARELVGDRGQHDALFDAVERRVQEGAERRGLARHPRVAAVQRVADRADDEGDAAGDPPALGTPAPRPRRRGRNRSARSRSGSAASRSGGCGRPPDSRAARSPGHAVSVQREGWPSGKQPIRPGPGPEGPRRPGPTPTPAGGPGRRRSGRRAPRRRRRRRPPPRRAPSGWR